VASKFKSKYGLQARLWKLALKDALETLDRYWRRLISQWKARISRIIVSEVQRHYLYKAIKTYPNLYEVIFYGPGVSLKMGLSSRDLRQCRRHLQRWIRKTVKKSPRVKIYRSFLAEPETYRIFTHKGRQYISIMTFTRGKRLCIPLTGEGKISGQIRIVLDFEKERVEVHHTVWSKAKRAKGKAKGIDLGITEVFTESDGDKTIKNPFSLFDA